jgi:hypothetical protein
MLSRVGDVPDEVSYRDSSVLQPGDEASATGIRRPFQHVPVQFGDDVPWVGCARLLRPDSSREENEHDE